MHFKFWGAALGAVLLCPGAAAQEDRPAYVRALAAGYKASSCAAISSTAAFRKNRRRLTISGARTAISTLSSRLLPQRWIDSARLFPLHTIRRCRPEYQHGVQASVALSFRSDPRSRWRTHCLASASRRRIWIRSCGPWGIGTLPRSSGAMLD